MPQKKQSDGSFSTEEDEGYLLAYLFDGKQKTSTFVVFDAKRIQDGPITSIPLQDFIPHSLHGTFVPGLEFDFEKAKRNSILMDMNDRKQWNSVNSDFSGLGIKQMLDEGS